MLRFPLALDFGAQLPHSLLSLRKLCRRQTAIVESVSIIEATIGLLVADKLKNYLHNMKKIRKCNLFFRSPSSMTRTVTTKLQKGK